MLSAIHRHSIFSFFGEAGNYTHAFTARGLKTSQAQCSVSAGCEAVEENVEAFPVEPQTS